MEQKIIKVMIKDKNYFSFFLNKKEKLKIINLIIYNLKQRKSYSIIGKI